MKMKRSDTLPITCCRCGSDLMTGRALILLPYCKHYLALCGVCSKGLGIEGLWQKIEPTTEQWEEFWKQEIEVKDKK